MADQLETLFADLRAETIHAIRPPGADRVRRTVRRRRTATVSAAVVLLVMLGGTVVLLGFPSSRPTTPAHHGRLPETDLERLTGVADRAVTAGSPGPAVFSRRGAVTDAFRATEQAYLGRLTLQVACAGAGSVTLLMRGRPGSESGTTERTEVARLTADCSAEPLPTGATFVLSQFLDISVEVVGTEGARGRAGFAYRATSDTGQPALKDGPNNPTSALRLPDPLPPGSGWGGGVAVTDRPHAVGWEQLNGDFRLAVACAGVGVLHVTVQQARSAADPKGTVSATKTFDAACAYPPQRQDFVVGRVPNRQVSLAWNYESSSVAAADVAYQFLPR